VGVRVHPVAAAQSTSVDVAVDVAPTFASAPTSAFTYVRPGTSIPSTVVDIAGQPSVGTPVHAGMLRGPALRTVVDVPRALGLTPSSVDDVARTSVVNVDVARPAYGLALPTVAEVARPPSPSSVDVVGPAYEGVHPYAPPSVDAPRRSSVDVRRPMPYVGMRQPRSIKDADADADADADEPSVGLTRSMCVRDRDRQGVGRSTSVDVVRQPHSSLMSVGITEPTPTPRQPSMVDVVHPPSMGASVVGPTSAHVSRQSDVAHPPGPQPAVGVDDALGIAKPTSANAGNQPGATATTYQSSTGRDPSQPTLASMLLCVRMLRYIRQLRLLLPSHYFCWVVMLRRHSCHPTPVCMSGCRHLGQLHPHLVRLSQCRLVALSYNRHSLPVPKQPWWCHLLLVRRVCHVRLGIA